MLLVTLVAAAGAPRLAFDFHAAYLPAAESVRAGGSPYASALANSDVPYIYPPVLAELLVPFTFLPVDVAAFIAFLASLAAVIGALALVGLRDVRCYAAVVIWAPTWNALEMANVSAALALVLALVWRYRTETWRPAAALGLALSVKLILWPMLLWLWATRRSRTAGLALAAAATFVLASWAIVGFAGLRSFPGRLGEIDFAQSYSLVGMSAALGFDPWVGRLMMAVFGGALLIAVALTARRGDEIGSFACATVAAFVFTPVVWLHYLVLLAVPLAIARPRFSAIWLVPIVLWVCPRAENGDGLQPFVPALVVLLLLALIVDRPDGYRRESEMAA